MAIDRLNLPTYAISILRSRTNVSWEFVETVWFWMVAIFKLCVWVLALVVVWLTLWARQLRRRAGGE